MAQGYVKALGIRGRKSKLYIKQKLMEWKKNPEKGGERKSGTGRKRSQRA